MKIATPFFAIGFSLFMASGAQAGVIFSDTLQTTLASANWASNTSGQIVAAPGGGFALNFAGLKAGGDLFSVLIPGSAAPGIYSLQFDYYSSTRGGAGGFIGLYPTGTTLISPSLSATDDWLASDTPAAYSTPNSFSADGIWETISFSFDVLSSTPFGLKLEDYLHSGPTAGDAYFRNIVLSNASAATPVPEPITLTIFGAGLVGAATLRRRKSKVG